MMNFIEFYKNRSTSSQLMTKDTSQIIVGVIIEWKSAKE